MATNLTRINNNQITDASAGNAYVGVNAAVKLQNYTVTSQKLANNINYQSDLQVTGNLTVTGTTTTVDTVNTLIEDPLIVLASGQTSGTPTVDIGYIGLRGAQDNIAMAWKENANTFVAAFTSTDSGNSYSNTTFSITSYADFKANNITANGTMTVTGNTTFIGNITAANVTGNVAADYYFGNGYYLTGINVASLAVNKIYNGGSYANIADSNGNLVVAVGSGSNIVATFYDLGLSVNGNITTANIFAQNLSLSGNVVSSLSVTGDIIGANITSVGFANVYSYLSVGGNITGHANLSIGNISATGSTTTDGNLTVGTGAGSGDISATGNLTLSSGNIFAQNLSLSGNVVSALSVTGDIIGANITSLGFANVRSYLSVGGNITGQANLSIGNISATGSTTTNGNLTVGTGAGSGDISATGNLTLSSGNIFAQNLSLSGNIISSLSVTGDIIGANITSLGFANVRSYLSVGGNITGQANLSIGNISATGSTATDGNLTVGAGAGSGDISATGN